MDTYLRLPWKFIIEIGSYVELKDGTKLLNNMRGSSIKLLLSEEGIIFDDLRKLVSQIILSS